MTNPTGSGEGEAVDVVAEALIVIPVEDSEVVDSDAEIELDVEPLRELDSVAELDEDSLTELDSVAALDVELLKELSSVAELDSVTMVETGRVLDSDTELKEVVKVDSVPEADTDTERELEPVTALAVSVTEPDAVEEMKVPVKLDSLMELNDEGSPD